jgi:hypothetical protein
MIGVVSTAVTEVEPANKRNIPRSVVTMADDEEFLVMRAEQAYSLVQQHLSSGVVDLTTEELVGSAADRGRHAFSMGSPHEAPDFHSRASQLREQVTD